MLLYLSSGRLTRRGSGSQGSHGGPQSAGEHASEAADDLALGPALLRPPGDVGLGWSVVLYPHDDDAVERGVGLPVPSTVQPVAGGHARGCGDGGDATELGEGGFGADGFGVVASHDEHLGGRVRPDGEGRAQVGRQSCGQFGQDLLVCLDLGIELLPASGDRPQGVFGALGTWAGDRKPKRVCAKSLSSLHAPSPTLSRAHLLISLGQTIARRSEASHSSAGASTSLA